jgi:hypothetical protein
MIPMMFNVICMITSVFLVTATTMYVMLVKEIKRAKIQDMEKSF